MSTRAAAPWVPDPQCGKRFLVTGGTSGLGLALVRKLAAAGATVDFTGVTPEECEAASAALGARAANARAHCLDLGSLDGVRAFARAFATVCDELDVLVCNAGVFGRPRTLTADGFEAHLGINHLGHFALTGQLWPLLARARVPRVIVVTSAYHRLAEIDLEDPFFEHRRYRRVEAYGQSKLANVLFARELVRRSAAVTSVVAHPGYVATTLVERGYEGMVMRAVTRLGRRLVAQPIERGVEPIIRAATDSTAVSGDCFGPGGFLELSGPATRVKIARRAGDEALARRLWEWSETVTGVRFP